MPEVCVLFLQLPVNRQRHIHTEGTFLEADVWLKRLNTLTSNTLQKGVSLEKLTRPAWRNHLNTPWNNILICTQWPVLSPGTFSCTITGFWAVNWSSRANPGQKKWMCSFSILFGCNLNYSLRIWLHCKDNYAHKIKYLVYNVLNIAVPFILKFQNKIMTAFFFKGNVFFKDVVYQTKKA